MPTSVASAVFIHPAVWPQGTWAEHWGVELRILFGEGSSVPMSPQSCWAEAYHHT